MKIQNQVPRNLFFHMGPGFHAEIERQKFAELQGEVLFLDQPPELNFSELVFWAQETIRSHYALVQKPLCLLGHSFGAQIISRALDEIGDKVCEIRLLNSAYDNFDCFANLESTQEPATARGADAWRSCSPEEKRSLIIRLFQNPEIANAYWAHPLEAAHSDYIKIASQKPSIDPSVFMRVYSEYLRFPEIKLKKPFSGPVTIYFSLKDNLIKDKKSIDPWSLIFPQAKFIEVSKVGHLGYFESQELASIFFQPTPY